ncbi:MAG: (d)CMP kinase [Deltaproteobacteria bacterium]|jgi:cytidylate kinase|nr:(d)CMP kinase [Deltaproteobacteria bacterium]
MGPKDIITIDGPSAAGKTTLARELSKRLGWSFLDTGSIYRAVGLAAMGKGLMGEPGPVLGGFVRGLDVSVKPSPEGSRVFLGEKEMTGEIRGEDVSKAASKISGYPEVREALADIQVRVGEAGRLVTEGRDQGTYIFPDARLKFFLTASTEERARRRFLELSVKDPTLRQEDVLHRVRERDYADESRAAAPLKPAKDAVIIDSTELSQDEVLAIMERMARERFPELL